MDGAASRAHARIIADPAPVVNPFSAYVSHRGTCVSRAQITRDSCSRARQRAEELRASEEYLPLIASAEARKPVGMARPEGSEHASPTIVIEGVAELIAALRAA